MAIVALLPLRAQTRWTGSDVDALLQQHPEGTEIFLYNVGTGRFVIHGGDWGTQARLFYETTGKMMKLKEGQYALASSTTPNKRNIIIDSGMASEYGGVSKTVFGCNVPMMTTNTGTSPYTGWEITGFTFTVLMDMAENWSNDMAGDRARSGHRNWVFTRVEDSDEAGNYTYYMSEVLGDSTVYMGAAYGLSWGTGAGESFVDHDGNKAGHGHIVLMSSSYDKVVWTTYSPLGNETDPHTGLSMESEVPIFNDNTRVPVKKLYQWRIVTREQLMDLLDPDADTGDGLSTDLTYLINDRGFERCDFSFFDYWTANRFTDNIYSGTGRYKYTWGYLTGAAGANLTEGSTYHNQSGTRTVSGQNHNQPVRLKSSWESKDNAKFGFMEFEGTGTATTYTTPTAPGVYKISAYGFYQNGGSEDHPGYLFATMQVPTSLSIADLSDQSKVSLSTPLKQVSGFDKSISGTADRSTTPPTKTGVMGAGYDFVFDKESYYREVEITVTQADVNAGKSLYFGVAKKASTSATSSVSGYVYDSDWVGADQFQISYLGTDPVMFDENEPNLDYLKDNGADKQYTNQTVKLKRTFVKDQWNSFVFPLDLTAVQVRNAFGDDCQVAEITELGEYSKLPTCIDFKLVDLPAEGNAIAAGKLYLVKPTKDPLTDSQGTLYYSLGKGTFNTADLKSIVTETVAVSQAAKDNANDPKNSMPASWLENEVTTYGSYVNDPTQKVPAGAYVMAYKKDDDGQGVQLYRITRETTIKGFRGWIVDTTGESPAANPLSVGGIYNTNAYVGPRLLIGDSNNDGLVSIADVTAAVNHILGKQDGTFIYDKADANKDGEITISDVTKIVNIVLGK